MEDMRGINDRHRNRRCYSCVKTRCHPAATRSIPAIGARGSSDVTAASCPVTGGRVYPFKLNAARTSAELALTFADWDLECFRDYPRLLDVITLITCLVIIQTRALFTENVEEGKDTFGVPSTKVLTMTMRVGKRYRCQNADCRCEIEVTKASMKAGANPTCCCGAEMKKPWKKPTFKISESKFATFEEFNRAKIE
jgi:hypothetical protein